MRRRACAKQESDFGSRSIERRTLRKSLAPTMALQIDAVQRQVSVLVPHRLKPITTVGEQVSTGRGGSG